MKYGSKSNSRTDPHGHWSWKPVHDNRGNLADLLYQLPQRLVVTWGRISDLFPGHAVIRCYANGYTYGTDGYFHTDSTRADEQTVIIYICDGWEPDWAGETVWQDPLRSETGYGCVSPAPNRALIIPSDYLHCARAVSRKCTELRTVLVYKVRPRRSDGFEKLSEFLVLVCALKHKHTQGTLHDHLVRVYQLLEDRKLPEAICFGGGLHSIYGTNVYKDVLLEPSASNRSMVAASFGKEAEALAYMFSVLGRPKALEYPISTPTGGIELQMRYDQKVAVNAQMYRSLCLIEAANLLDQNSLDMWPNLKRIWEAA